MGLESEKKYEKLEHLINETMAKMGKMIKEKEEDEMVIQEEESDFSSNSISSSEFKSTSSEQIDSSMSSIP